MEIRPGEVEGQGVKSGYGTGGWAAKLDFLNNAYYLSNQNNRKLR